MRVGGATGSPKRGNLVPLVPIAAPTADPFLPLMAFQPGNVYVYVRSLYVARFEGLCVPVLAAKRSGSLVSMDQPYG